MTAGSGSSPPTGGFGFVGTISDLGRSDEDVWDEEPIYFDETNIADWDEELGSWDWYTDLSVGAGAKLGVADLIPSGLIVIFPPCPVPGEREQQLASLTPFVASDPVVDPEVVKTFVSDPQSHQEQAGPEGAVWAFGPAGLQVARLPEHIASRKIQHRRQLAAQQPSLARRHTDQGPSDPLVRKAADLTVIRKLLERLREIITPPRAEQQEKDDILA